MYALLITRYQLLVCRGTYCFLAVEVAVGGLDSEILLASEDKTFGLCSVGVAENLDCSLLLSIR